MINHFYFKLQAAVRYLGLDRRDFVTFTPNDWNLWDFLRHASRHSQGNPQPILYDMLSVTSYLGTDAKQFYELTIEERAIDDFRREVRDGIREVAKGQYARWAA